MTNRYKILFAADILNDYYKDNLCTDFAIVASPETELVLKKYQLICKVVLNKLVVLVKTDDTGIPVINIKPAEKFVFYLNLDNPSFINFTNIDLEILDQKRFLFTNINQNKASGLLNVSAKITNYNNTASYKPGDFADNGANTVFECIKSTTGNNTATAFWTSRQSNQFVSSADMIATSPKILNYTVSAAAKIFTINVFSLNKITNTYTDVVKTQTQTFAQETNSIQIDLRSISSGKYRITVNTDELIIYIDNAFVYGNYFGVIEIFSHLPNTNEFSFFEAIAVYNNITPYKRGDLADDGSGNIFECIQNSTGHNTANANFWKARTNVPGKLREVNYSMRFANRRAFWKYFSNYKKIDNIKVKGSHNPVVTPFDSFSSDPVGHPLQKDFFVSESQLLISEKTDENNFELMLAHPLESFSPAVPKPNLAVSGMLTQQDKNFFCNIYLNF